MSRPETDAPFRSRIVSLKRRPRRSSCCWSPVSSAASRAWRWWA